ncbi:MAG: hypothetical protein ACE5FJ_01425 [Gemmatimonadales bacterium]
MGIEVLPPSVNESGHKFTVIADDQIRFGLGAIKNVGSGAVDSILQARKTGGAFGTLQDLCERIDLHLCNKRVIESLIAAGAADALEGNRAQLTAALDHALQDAQLTHAEREAGQVSLFDDGGALEASARSIALPDLPQWPEHERLAREKEVVGFFISGHPLEKFREEVTLFGTRTTATLGTWSEHEVTAAVIVTQIDRRISRKTGAEYARLTLEDFHGTAEAIVFPDKWRELSSVIQPDQALVLTGSYSTRDRDEEQAPFIVEGAQAIESLRESGAVGLGISWTRENAPNPGAVKAVAALCLAHPGAAPVVVDWGDGNGSQARLQSRNLRVALSNDLVSEVRKIMGPERVRLVRVR